MRASRLFFAAIAGLGCSGSGSPGSGDCNYIGVVPLDFGQVEVGTLASLTLQIENLGQGPITIEAIDVADGGPLGEFLVDRSFQGQSLQPGGFLSVDVTFSPMAAGERQAELVIAGDNCSRTIAADGTGISPQSGEDAGSCSPVQATLDFGNVVVGASLTLPLVVDNCRQGQLMMGMSGDPDFTVSGVGQGIAPGQTETFRVTYAPAVAGSLSVEEDLLTCTTCLPVMIERAVDLTGTGMVGTLTLSSAVNGDAGTTFTCTNTGNWPLVLDDLRDGEFALSNEPPFPLDIGVGQSFSFIETTEVLDAGGNPTEIDGLYGPPGLAASWTPILPL